MEQSADQIADGSGQLLLAGYTALDLTSGSLRFAASFLTQFGVEVVRPTGDLEREQSVPDGWFENAGKQLWVPASISDVHRVAAASDIIVLDDSSEGAWGLSPAAARDLNPRAIVTAITPYGLEGPYSDHRGSERTLQAAGGLQWFVGHLDRAPVGLPGNQAAYQASGQAAVATLAALYHRSLGEGSGELIDVSVQEAVCQAVLNPKPHWYIDHRNLERHELASIGGGARARTIWEAKDGYITWRLVLGMGAAGRVMREVVDWIRTTSEYGASLGDVEWGNISTLEVTEGEISSWEDEFARFFRERTRAQLFKEARERDIVLVPVLRPEEVMQDEHVVARAAFQAANDGQFRVPRWPLRSAGIASDRSAPRVVESPSTRIERAPRAPERSSFGAGPLAGVKILDFGWAIAGPATTRVLGLLGATVVKVETNTRLDGTRTSPPFAGRPSRDRSGIFAQHNNNKLSLTLNLKTPQSRAIVERLVRWADVVTDNFSAGTMDLFGLGYDQLSQWNPAVIMLSSSTWGMDGPYRALGGHGVILGGFAGYNEINGWPDRAPLYTGDPYPDIVSPWFAASGIVAALITRQRTATGRFIEVAQLDCAMNFIGPEFTRASMGTPVTRKGVFSCDPFPTGVFRAPGEQEWCAVSIAGRREWEALCEVVPGLSGSGDMDEAAISENRSWIFSLISQHFMSKPATNAARELQLKGVAASKVAKPEDLYNDPQLSYRHHFVELPHPSMSVFIAEMPSYRFERHPITPTPTPNIGEHTGLILGEMLGYSADEIADFYAESVLD